jgi:hypothetical protein
VADPRRKFSWLRHLPAGTTSAAKHAVTDREAKSRAVKILAKSIYRDLEAQGFDEKQIVSLATELISEVTNKISRDNVKAQVA